MSFDNKRELRSTSLLENNINNWRFRATLSSKSEFKKNQI